jgi:hypothetical protein
MMNINCKRSFEGECDLGPPSGYIKSQLYMSECVLYSQKVFLIEQLDVYLKYLKVNRAEFLRITTGNYLKLKNIQISTKNLENKFSSC